MKKFAALCRILAVLLFAIGGSLISTGNIFSSNNVYAQESWEGEVRVSLDANPRTITSGQPVTFSWYAENVNSSNTSSDIQCENSEIGIGMGDGSSGQRILYPTETASYRLNCYNDDSGVLGGYDTVTVVVNQPVSAAPPDITVDTGPSVSGTTGQPVTLSALVKNIGGSSTSGSFANVIWLDASTGGPNIGNAGSHTVGPLSAGASQSISGSATFNSPGTYYYIACANDSRLGGSTVSESNGGNNCGGHSSITITNAAPPPPPAATPPDLTAQTGANLSGTTGQTLTLPATIRNGGGSATSGSFANTIWIDAPIGTTYGRGGPVNAGPLGAGSSQNVSGSFTFNSPGTFYYIVCANDGRQGGGTVSESDGGNNCGSWSTITITNAPVAATPPDLTAQTGGNLTAQTGATLSLPVTIRNQGGSATSGSFANTIWIDSPQGNTYGRGGPVNAGPISAGGSQSVSGSFTFNTPGTYYYIACANDARQGGGTVSESDGGNNCGSFSTITISDAAVPPPPPAGAADLTAGGVTPGTATVNQPVNFSAMASNIGSATSGNFPILFQIDTAPGAPQILFNSGYVSGLGAGGSGWGGASYTFSAPGRYIIRACANFNTNWTGITPESTWDNNCGAWSYVDVASAPAGGADLTITDYVGVTSTVVGPTTFSAATYNIGSAASTNFPVLYQVYGDDNYRHAEVAGIAAGGSRGSSVSYTWPAAGEYVVRACANKRYWASEATETNYGNNCGPDRYVTVTAAAPPQRTCRVSATTVEVGNTVAYYITGNGETGYYQWSGSDGYSSAGTIVQRSFSTPGSYGMTAYSYMDGQASYCPLVTAGSLACTNPSVSLTASPSRVRAGQSTTLSWNASGVDVSCTVTGPNVNQTFPANACTTAGTSLTVPNINTQSKYTISCDNGESTDDVVVNVIPKFEEF